MRKDDVVIRGTKEGILVALGEGDDYLTLRRRLEERLSRAGRLLRGSEVTLDAGTRKLTNLQVHELETMITQTHGLRLRDTRCVRIEDRFSLLERIPLDERPTATIRRSLRSGQRAAYDGNLVVFADVHAGAEVVATGDVVVMGGLYGVAHAGARGVERSMVVALHLQPTQLRIGRQVARPPDEDRLGATPGPEVARVRDGQIVIESLAVLTGAERRETAWARSS